ncbi:ABC transporter permease [Lutispora thermophila]|uniref:ABC transporter permease n=1 Tax=Lutispora saccharofermentans TaxID=3024236 RepID=A0ABT1NE41_9FIRM|nr:ABC transporter permease [Lutispora saccharofermentans]MCQ1529505.1 ABC transporter permease [Lutispora saccharofermentans]
MTQEANAVAIEKKYAKKSQIKEIWRRMKKNKLAMIGLAIFCILVAMSLSADLIADYQESAIKQNGSLRLQPPSWEHYFGTDQYGRDLLARMVHGSRVSLSIGFFTTGISLLIGGILGAMTGYYGGIFDEIVMRLMDILLSIPSILLAIAIVSAMGPSLLNLLIAITISQIPGFTRIVRSTVLTVVGEDYIEAARACGSKDFRIITNDVLPNAIGPIIVQGTMSVAKMILLAAGLSFIGLGIQPPQPEWGYMLSEAREYMRDYPYLVVIPGIAIAISVFSINLIGDGLRDALDPRLKN